MRSSTLLLVWILGLVLNACRHEGLPPGPFEVTEEKVWRVVNRSHTGDDGIFVQATFRTFAYEISRVYSEAEQAGLAQEQVDSRLRELVYAFVDGRYPTLDGTDINNLYFQYLIYVNPDFDPTNPIKKSQFDVWRGGYIRRLFGTVFDRKYQILRPTYDGRWGNTLYSRLVFSVYLDNEDTGLHPRIDDIGDRTFLVDDQGNRYAPSGTAGPYPYEFDRPDHDHLQRTAVYRLFFPNRQADRTTPIVSDVTEQLSLVIEGLGTEAERRLTWDLPLVYPEMPARRLIPVPGSLAIE
ncbi:MAG: hypothetical protein HOH74_00100 [Gemmatimonadetes bacterium]|jgi:hypothetical protein|nr:hypothetical protein [Gemmatimonadota bacterium]